MTICYSGRSAPSAQRIADQSDDIFTVRGSEGDVNWGRNRANTELNPDISNVTNKRRMRELFRDNDVPMPKMYNADLEAICATGGVLVGRPDYHMRGRGFWLCRTPQDIRRALAGTSRKAAATHFMEFIEASHELRVHIFRGKSIRISEKQGYGNTYTTIKPTIEVKQARKAAKKAMRAVGLDFGAVDILVKDDGSVYVLEVNAAPGVGGTMPALYAQAFEDWYDEER